MSNNRPFRSLTAKQYKNIVYRITGLRCSSSATSNLFVDGMSCSTLYCATPYHTKGAVIPLPLNHSKYTNPVTPPVIFAHPGQDIQDVSFSPHAPNVLATVAKDDSLKIFELPSTGVLESTISQATVTVNDLTGAGCIAWHPTTRGLIAVGCKDSIILVSVDYDTFGTSTTLPTESITGRQLIKLPTITGAGKDIARVSWSYNGQYLIAIGKDGALYICDPRQVKDFDTPMKSYTDVLGDMKNPHLAFFITQNQSEPILFIGGLGRARKPCYRVCKYDPTTSSLNVMCQGDLTCSSGQLLGHYDYDTQLIYIAPRSAQNATIYDTTLVSGVVSTNSSLFNGLINIPIPVGTKGMAPVPKSKCSIDDSEIINFYSHSGEAVELYSVAVVRKDRGFHPDLYPNTYAGQATLSLDDYMEGKNVQPVQYNLGSSQQPTPAVTKPTTTTTTQPETSAIAQPEGATTPTASTTTPEQHVSAHELLSNQKGYDKNIRTTLDATFHRTTFLHCSGMEPGLNKDHYAAYDVKVPKQHLAYGKTLVANNTFYAVPNYVAGGSLIYTRLLTETGRVPTKVTGIAGPSPVSALSVSQLNHYQLATASDDGVVRVYNLPTTWKSGELPENITEPTFTFPLGVRIQVLQYHTYIEHCIVATGYDAELQQEILFVFDVTPGTESESRYQAYTHVVQDRASHIDFSPDGCHISIANKKSQITIVSMPGGTVVIPSIAHGTQPKESWALWYSKDYLVTIGFVRGGERGVTLHKIDYTTQTTTVVKSLSFSNTYLLIPYLDISTGVLITAGVGTANCNVFYINPNQAPYVDGLSVFQSRGDVVGMAYLPKANVDVKEVEVIKSIKLNQTNEIWPVSWRLPRKRKEFYQDDVYQSGAPQLKTIVSSQDYFNSVLENAVTSNPNQTQYVLQYQSLHPAGMIPLSEAPEEELTDRQQKYLQMKATQHQTDKPKGFLGHTTNEEVDQYYIDKMERVGVNSRWVARTDQQLEDVSDSEWD